MPLHGTDVAYFSPSEAWKCWSNPRYLALASGKASSTKKLERLLDGVGEEVGVVVVELEQRLELLDAPLDVASSAAQESLPQVGNSFWKTHFFLNPKSDLSESKN